MKSLPGRYFPLLLLAVLVTGLQLLLSALKADFYLTQLTMAAYYSLVALGLCLLMGYAGQVSLGQAGFFAIGGYTTAVLSTVGVTTLGMAAWMSVPAAVIVTAAVALVYCYP